MQFLKTVLAAILLPIVLVIMLAVVSVGLVGFYVAWLVGMPVKVKIRGVESSYRWLKQVP